ncbi:hypothetical protein J4E86_010717 [Alternaria arbusti]|uniref:uncharacterized protein n=1 Tax=Alternaria arbusti TaxID=232088 RepID=UPI00221EDFAA|nr:uncharacterized protein J4E86_010717 [Alternaria arbusti]KAI4940745.1 hypothetical protein J4E86_010717 [Alternaria arbusti]
MFKRVGRGRTREAIRWRLQQYGRVKQFEEHGISCMNLSPAFEREIAAQTAQSLLGPSPAAASETGAAIVRPNMREASLIEAANSQSRINANSIEVGAYNESEEARCLTLFRDPRKEKASKDTRGSRTGYKDKSMEDSGGRGAGRRQVDGSGRSGGEEFRKIRGWLTE